LLEGQTELKKEEAKTKAQGKSKWRRCRGVRRRQQMNASVINEFLFIYLFLE
jgi:hypothetical protein